MGYMRHHAIVVSGWKKEYVQQAREMAIRIFSTVGRIETDHDNIVIAGNPEDYTGDRGHLAPLISDIIDGSTNGYSSFAAFFIAPDGSKEWWDTSNAGDRARDRFVEWIRSDDAPYLQWAEIQYGDEEGNQRLTRASDLEEEK